MMRTFFTDLDVLTQINMLKEKIGPDKQYEKGTCDYFEDLQGVNMEICNTYIGIKILFCWVYKFSITVIEDKTLLLNWKGFT